MKIRDILILMALVGLVLILTVAEKYAERRREARQEQEHAAELQRWQKRITVAFENRWATLSGGLRATLDSIAQEVVASGVSQDSLAAVLVQAQSGGTAHTEAVSEPASDAKTRTGSASAGPQAKDVMGEYEKALAALPRDLNAYEKRIATNEVASLVRARFGLSLSQFDAMLKEAAARP
jgi:hypothetical protein